ncbi:MAG TPA: polysaccharide biosynthesis tyrosine autokinase [Acidimicrobiales bacterium]|jgi:capsular exopolysaccharide synthesis family protein
MDVIDDQSRSGLREYLQILRRRRWIIILTTLVFLAVAIGYGEISTPVYQGTAQLLITPQLSTTLLEASNSNITVGVDVPTSTQIIESQSVSNYVKRSIPNAPDVAVAQVGITDVVTVSVQSTNAKLAAQAANAYANAYIHVEQSQAISQLTSAAQVVQTNINALNAQISQDSAGINVAGLPTGSPVAANLTNLQERVSVLEDQKTSYQFAESLSTGGGQVVTPATVPTSPVKPKKVEYAILAGVLGLAIGLGLAVALEFFDDGIRTRNDLERVSGGLPVVGVVPEIVDWRDDQAQYLVSWSSPKSIPAEAYRGLRTSIQFLGLDRAIKTVQFTSPSAAEGKTTTMVNLAVVMAQAGHRVSVVCCDLRRPRLHGFFNLSNQVGFTSVLLGEATLEEALQPVPGLERLQVLASGQIPPNPSELLSGTRAADLLAQLGEQSDIVLIDSPPVLPVTDAAVLAGRVDSVVLVTSVGISTRSQVTRALELLGRVEASVSGVVLNRASESDTGSYYHYAYGVPTPSTRAGRNGKSVDALQAQRTD